MKRILALFLVFILYLVGSEVVAYGALNEDAKKVDERAAIEDRGASRCLGRYCSFFL